MSSDAEEVFWATKSILEYNGPVYMRTEEVLSQRIKHSKLSFEIGKGNILKDGGDVTIISCGVQVARSLEAADILQNDGINAQVIKYVYYKTNRQGIDTLFALRKQDVL